MRRPLPVFDMPPEPIPIDPSTIDPFPNALSGEAAALVAELEWQAMVGDSWEMYYPQ